VSVAPEHEHTGPWSLGDVLDLPESTNKYELIDGALIVSPPPSGRHQDVLFRLHTILAGRAEHRMWQGLGVQLDAHRYGDRMLVPDLVVAKSTVDGGDPVVLPAADVLLAVEIVSPGSRVMDRSTKPSLYAEAGIPYYWRIELDPFRGNTQRLPVVVAASLGGSLDDEVCYVVQAEVGAGTQLELEWPFPISFDPAELIR
jgi:Uma2 family endonuclease